MGCNEFGWDKSRCLCPVCYGSWPYGPFRKPWVKARSVFWRGVDRIGNFLKKHAVEKRAKRMKVAKKRIKRAKKRFRKRSKKAKRRLRRRRRQAGILLRRLFGEDVSEDVPEEEPEDESEDDTDDSSTDEPAKKDPEPPRWIGTLRRARTSDTHKNKEVKKRRVPEDLYWATGIESMIFGLARRRRSI